ncbi:hypothetical protein SCUP234_12310 [Seiridium cupressi]
MPNASDAVENKALCECRPKVQSHPYPATPPPSANGKHAKGTADFTFDLSAEARKSQTENIAPEYLLNEKPRQLFWPGMNPFLFTDLSKSDTRGSRAHSNLSRQSVQDAVRDIEDGSASLNLHDPPLVPVHDLLPLGWSVLRVQVTTKVTTILLAVKHKYFVLEISVPILEGITADDLVVIPTSAIERPHVKFDPENDGVFG